MFDRICDTLFGKAGIRRIPTTEKNCYLTFDDGPDAEWTPLVLDILDRHQVKATFFVISLRAQKNVELIQRILASGHAIGDHSWDHDHSMFFSGIGRLEPWVINSQNYLKEITAYRAVGFRSPNGVHTPGLSQVIRKLDLPLVLWDVRFFDGLKPFIFNERKCRKIQPGSIVLLHDVQKHHNKAQFQNELEKLIVYLVQNAWNLKALDRQALRQANH